MTTTSAPTGGSSTSSTSRIPGRWPGRSLRLTIHQVAALFPWLAVTAGLMLVSAMWWSDNPTVPAGAGARWIAAGRLFGLYGAALASAAVLLQSRVPWLDRAVGTDRLARLHARLGRIVIGALSAHVGCIVTGYARRAHVSPVSQIRTLWSAYPHVLMAGFGFAMLLLVGATSAGIVRANLPYELWHLLHLGTYLAIGLAFAHTLVVGDDFVGHPVHRRAWEGWFLAVAITVGWFRWLRPLLRMLVHRTVVAGTVAESHDVVSISVTGRRLHRFGGQPGQFVRVRFCTRGRWWQSHPFSLSAVPDGHRIRISVKGVGDHTRGLREVRPGTRVLLTGPYGGLIGSRRTCPDTVLVAGGIGITPLRALFETFTAASGRTMLIYRVRTEQDLVLRDELDTLACRAGASVLYLIGPHPRDPADEPLAALGSLVPDIAQRDVFVCGPPAMMTAVIATARRLGVPRRHIHAERFSL
jgi:predicted ferric reductase